MRTTRAVNNNECDFSANSALSHIGNTHNHSRCFLSPFFFPTRTLCAILLVVLVDERTATALTQAIVNERIAARADLVELDLADAEFKSVFVVVVRSMLMIVFRIHGIVALPSWVCWRARATTSRPKR